MGAVIFMQQNPNLKGSENVIIRHVKVKAILGTFQVKPLSNFLVIENYFISDWLGRIKPEQTMDSLK